MKARSNNINDYPDAALLTPSKYIKKEELQASGPCALTVSRIEPAHELKSERGSELKCVMFFRETDKGMVLNVTNNGRMVECYDRDPRKWLGKKIVIKSGTNKGKAGVAIDVAATLRLPVNGGRQPRLPDAAERPDTLDDAERQLAEDACLAEQSALEDEPGARE